MAVGRCVVIVRPMRVLVELKDHDVDHIVWGIDVVRSCLSACSNKRVKNKYQ